MKKNLFTVCCFFTAIFFMSLASQANAAFNHGSMKGTGLQLYGGWKGDPGGADHSVLREGYTADYKIVTINSLTWAYVKFNGANANLSGEEWAAQVFYRKADTTLDVNGNSGHYNLTQRTGNTVAYGKMTASEMPGTNPTNLSLFGYLTNFGQWQYGATASVGLLYNVNEQNSKNVNDVTAPVWAFSAEEINKTATNLTLKLSASDESGDMFYYVTDTANDYYEVFFTDTVSITLAEGTDYEFIITPVDFSGNTGDSEKVIVSGETFVCNNLMAGKTLVVGEIYYAPGWTPSSNYTFVIEDDTVASIHLGDATSENWQAQLRAFTTSPVLLTPGETYSLIANVNISKNAPFHLKMYDTAGGDGVAMEITQRDITAGDNKVAVYDVVCPEELTKINGFLFNLSWNPADIDYLISVQICGGETVPPVAVRDFKKADNSSMAVYMQGRTLTVISENAIKRIDVFSAGGHKISVKQNGNTVDMSSLASGLYIIKVTDAAGVQKQFKQVVAGR